MTLCMYNYKIFNLYFVVKRFNELGILHVRPITNVLTVHANTQVC